MRSATLMLRATAIAIAGALLLGGAVAPASASDVSDAAQLQWYADNGVNAKTAKYLVEKVNSGTLLDSMNGSKPVRERTFEKDGWITTRSVFADGSISVSKLETPSATSNPGIAAASVGGCASTQSGSGYVNYYQCAVYGSNGYFDMSFRADYTRTSAGTGIINAVNSPYAYAAGGSAPTPVLKITRKTSSGTTPAKATATTQYSSTAVSFTGILTLSVTGAQASSSQNF